MKFWSWVCLIICIALTSCESEDEQVPLDKNQETAFFYLYNQTLISDTFSRILYKAPIDFRAVDREKQLLYFVFDTSLNKEEMVSKIAKDTSLVEFAPCKSGPCNFGGLEGSIDGIYALRIPMSNLNADSTLHFPMELKTMKDSLSYNAVTQLMDSNLYYSGEPFWEINGTACANLGVLVMKKNTTTPIYRFAQRIKGRAQKKEDVIQKVLDVVANEIEYSYADFWYKTEIFQRAHEVLISGYADCSGKTVLMASLLEQLDIPYQILYYKQHVNIAISGKFSGANKLHCDIKGKTYYLAECTCPNFKIGRTKLQGEILPQLSYYQNPRKSIDIYDYVTHEKKKLYSKEAMEEYMGY